LAINNPKTIEKRVVLSDLPIKSVGMNMKPSKMKIENKVRHPNKTKTIDLVLSEAYCTINLTA
jgi:hypothetical protein